MYSLSATNDSWAYSPLLATMNVVQVTDSTPSEYPKLTRLQENTHFANSSSIDRRKFLSSQQTRSETPFPSTFIAGDFSNPFVDFNSFSVTLPYVGFKVDVFKVLD